MANDVCGVLGLKNSRQVVAGLPDNEKNTVHNMDGILLGPGNPNVNIINEPGLYRLIFQCRKPEAEAFKNWVFEEVLPAIRKQGFYALEKRIKEMQWQIDERDGRIYQLEKIAGDPQEIERRALRRYIMKRFVSTDERHFCADGNREYYIYANNEELVLDKSVFMAEVQHCFPTAKSKSGASVMIFGAL